MIFDEKEEIVPIKIEYKGAKIFYNQVIAIQDIERLISRFDLSQEINKCKQCFTLKNNNIHEITLAGSRIKSLPESIGKLHSLKHLNLHNCYLENLPERIGDLKSLKHLDLSRNQLESLPDSLFDLNSLETLKLNGNPLRQLSKLIGKLTSLKKVDISFTKLRSLPSSIIKLKALQELNIKLNPISDEKYDDWLMLDKLRSRGVKILQSSDSYYRSIAFGPIPDSACPDCGSGNLETDDSSYWLCPDCGLDVTKG